MRNGSPVVYRYSFIIGCAGILTTLFCTQLLQRVNDEHSAEALSKATVQIADAVIARLKLYQYGLRGVNGAVLTAGEDQITKATFLRYSATRDVQSEFPGVRGFGFVRRVPESEEATFINKMRLDENPTYGMRQFSPHEGERFLIQFIDPQLSNTMALGLDLASEKHRKQAAVAAIRSGTVQITAPITLMQARDKQERSFLMLMPVYSSITTPQSQEERDSLGLGWSYAPLSADFVIKALGFQRDVLHLRLTDVTDPANELLFYDSSHEFGPQRDILFKALEREVLGRQWRFEVMAQPAFIYSLRQVPPYLVLIIGILLTVLLTALTAALLISRMRRTEVITGRARLASIVESSTDAIITETHERTVTSWNLGAEELFGFTAQEATGRKLTELIGLGKTSYEEEHFSKKVWQGERISSFNTKRRHKDGTVIDVSISIAPIYGEDGKVAGASKTVRDITSEKQSETLILGLNASLEYQVAQRTSQLQELNTLFSSVLRSASLVSIIATDLSGLITLFNEGATRLLGYKSEDMVGIHTPDVFHASDELLNRCSELSHASGQAISTIHALTYLPQLRGAETREWTYIRKDGSRFPVTLHVTAMRTDDGNICGYLYIAIDISVRKEAELRLAERVENTRAILDTAINPVLSINVEGIIQSFNTAGEDVFGYTKKEARGRSILSLITADAQSAFSVYINDVVDGAVHSKLENNIFHGKKKNGNTFPFQMSLGATRLEGERILVCIITDVSEQQQQQKELVAIRDQLLLAAEVAELGIWTWSLKENSLVWNDRMFEIYAQSLPPETGELNFEHWRSRVHPDDIDDATELLNAALKGSEMFETAFRVVRPDGVISYVQASARIERDVQGKPSRVTGINRDITAQRELESRLLEAKERADAASAAKSFFLANMSHEIRTPMNAVLGMLQLMHNTSLTNRQIDYVQKAQVAAKSLLGLLNDILDYSKIEAGKLQLDLHPFELEPLMRDLAIVLAGNQSQQEVEVMFELDSNLPACVQGDSLRLQQIFINLAGNALKFTTSGQVLVSVTQLERTEAKVAIRIAVTDTGIGISPEQAQRIFEGFTQAEASTSRRFGGTGLGLVICKRLITLMGGELHVESTQGVGSCFWFEITLDIAQPAPLRSCCPGVDSQLKVLVVDDNLVAGEIMHRTVSALGWQPEHVESGRLAIRRIAEARSRGEPYDIVLMDWKMPEMDGLSAATQIQMKDQISPPLIIMITAYGREILANAHHEGSAPFSCFLTKPVTPKQLAEAVHEAFQRMDTPISPLSPFCPPLTGLPFDAAVDLDFPSNRLYGMRILVVEDNELNRQVARELLTHEGATVELAKDGLEGVQIVTEGQQSFDAVLMDIQMPDIDGMEATRKIRLDSRFTLLPIIAMTANASQSDRSACLEAGMNEHIGKPIVIDQLVKVLTEQASKNSLRSAHVLPLNSHELPLTQSRKEILDRFGGQLELIRSMLTKAEPELAKIIESLESAVSGNDFKAACAALHSFRGSAATLGAKRLAYLAASIESTIKNPSTDELVNLFAQKDWIAQLRDVLKCTYEQLTHIFNDNEISRPIANLETYSPTAWHESLALVLKLLEVGNLKAIKDCEVLHARTPATLKEQFQEFLNAVHALDFARAVYLGKSMNKTF